MSNFSKTSLKMLKTITKTCISERSSHILRALFSTEIPKTKWDLLTSVCLERKPIITPTLNKIEIEFQEYLNQVEYERSLKSDHEIRHENDKKKAELLKKGDVPDIDLDSAQLQTAQDFKDACVEELSKFKFANRTTENDSNLKSVERKLEKYLVLVTEQKIGKRKYFLPPQGTRKDGETLKQTAERVLKESCGGDVKARIYGNAPIGFYKYKYPKEVQGNGAVGAKVFIYFARYLDGQIPDKTSFKWLDRNELCKEIPKDFHNSLSKVLIDDVSIVQTEISS